MDSNKQLDELFQQMKKVDRSAKAKQDGLEKLKARVHKKKKFHLAPAFISFAMISIVVILFMTYSTNDSPLLDGQSSTDNRVIANEQTIQKVLEQEFTGPNKQFIQLKMHPTPLSDETGNLSDPMDLHGFLKDTYGSYFTESGFEQFVPYAFFYHLGEETAAYEISLGDVEIIQEENAPSHYTFTFEVNFVNGIGVSQKFPMSGQAVFAEEGILKEIVFEDIDGLSVTILENI